MLRLSVEPEELPGGHRDVCRAEDLLDVGHVLRLCDGLALQRRAGGLARFLPLLLLGLDVDVGALVFLVDSLKLPVESFQVRAFVAHPGLVSNFGDVPAGHDLDQVVSGDDCVSSAGEVPAGEVDLVGEVSLDLFC